MNNIGIILPNLSGGQLVYEVFDAIHGIKNNVDYDVVVFFEDYTDIPIKPPCACMHLTEIPNFKGKIIATNLSSASFLLKKTIITEKIFYVYDLEWIRGKNQYLINYKLYNSMPLYTRSEDYAKELKNYANVDAKVMSVIDFKEF